ncbi:MAG: peptidoglycan DD-metalloendopeptidase family protein [Clostridia bacterium]|nr:peptidoglycan DD-metalloendopeptidase family protein [Clostridia bacterium]
MKKITFDNTGIRRFFNKTGFYIAMSACLAAVGAVAFHSFKSSGLINPAEINAPGSSQMSNYDFFEEAQKVQKNARSIVIEEKDENARSQEPKPRTVSQAERKSSEKEPEKLSYAFPCGNTIIGKYSEGELIYSETMQDWRSHDGIDLACNQNEEIKSIAAGTVKAATEEITLGKCVTIEHPGGVLAKYCGLAEINVVENEQVQMGQTIGKSGTVPFEADMEPHLHLEIMIDGRNADPESFLGKIINKIN